MFEKIFKSFDFVGNRIKNAKVDTPEEDEHIANKIFVDSKTIYSTEKVQRFINPFKLDWVTSPANKNVLELFDDIFFPVIPPTYVNPTLLINLKNINSDGKFIFNGTPMNIEFDIKLTPGDRRSLEVPVLEIEYTDSDIDTIEFDSQSYQQTFSKVLLITKNYKSIKIKWQFSRCDVKLDNYGEESITQEYSRNYELVYDVLKDIANYFTIIDSPVYYKSGYVTEFDNDFIKTNQTINYFSDGITIFIPKYLINISDVFIGNAEILMLSAPIDEQEINSVLYSCYHLDLGKYPSDRTFDLIFKPKTNFYVNTY